MATMNLVGSASGDDGWCEDNGGATGFFPTEATNELVGVHAGQNGAVGIWKRFVHADILLLRNATINSAIFKPMSLGQTGSPITRVYAENAANPSAPSTSADYRSRALTSAFTAVSAASPSSGVRWSIDVTSVIQELVADFPTTIEKIQMLWKNNGSAGSFTFYHIDSYDSAPGDAAQLDIDYTPAGGVAVARRRR